MSLRVFYLSHMLFHNKIFLCQFLKILISFDHKVLNGIMYFSYIFVKSLELHIWLSQL